MIYVFRVILDTDADIFRDLEVKDNANLEDLHETILTAFDIEKGEMAAFYKSDTKWNVGEEIPLIAMKKGSVAMSSVMLHNYFSTKKQMLYLYDFLKMWTFYVELMLITDEDKKKEYPSLLFTKGTAPKSPPIKSFISEKIDNAGNNTLSIDEIGDDFDDINDLDY